MKGYTHIYTGNGKGKTTAAFGLALRASGAGRKVFIGQFVKGRKYNEIEAINKYLDNIVIKQYGLDCFIEKDPTKKDIEAARNGLKELARIIYNADYDIVVMDEIFIALYYRLFPIDEVIEIIDKKPEKTELVLTGRYAPQEIIDVADLVTEMKEIKHYYNTGVLAREGIEY
jgi:cob(I)alamin adenosyltransferase